MACLDLASECFQQGLHGRNVTSVNGITHEHGRGSVVDILARDEFTKSSFMQNVTCLQMELGVQQCLIKRRAVKRGAQEVYCLVHLSTKHKYGFAVHESQKEY